MWTIVNGSGYCKAHNIAFIPWFPLNAGNVTSQAVLKQIAERYSATVQQVALNWLLNHADNILLIPGTSKAAHLEENLQSVFLELSGDDIILLNSISPQ
ncbi:aldo/keto reductase [Mucilaginibacter sp.]|uniref:aldo/keto reductase n=1 Tax=Mucilaginibacter sp. TaxID=1882438 RepID=UPI002849EF28|nr:aldo/keto reductase [Mucilaginibacter sp.]MDR3695872.1 aldo/keto reductase [Mucilaginibacter sp.]